MGWWGGAVVPEARIEGDPPYQRWPGWVNQWYSEDENKEKRVKKSSYLEKLIINMNKQINKNLLATKEYFLIQNDSLVFTLQKDPVF